MTSSDIHSRRRNPTFDKVTADDVVVPTGRGVLHVTGHHTNYASGLAGREIARYQLKDDEKMQVWRLGVERRGGGVDSNVVVDAYDVATGSVIAETTAGSVTLGQSGQPAGESSNDTNSVILRISTGGTDVDITIQGILAIVGED